MVNVEADALAGPLLARRAREAGIVYSLAYGDQPALICEMVDWCRAAGFEVVAAGKGTKYLPEYHASTPDTVWPYYGFSPERVAAGDFNAQMFNSFLDGTKSAIEMAAVANATGLTPAPDGLAFPPCGVDDLPRVLRPARRRRAAAPRGPGGGDLEPRARRPPGVPRPALGRLRDVPRGRRTPARTTCAAASASTASRPIRRAATRRCTSRITRSGSSSASASRPSACAASRRARRSPGTATSSRPRSAISRAGETLDGEGGYTVYGKLLPAADSLAQRRPAARTRARRQAQARIAAHASVRWDDVDIDAGDDAVRFRREMESAFAR